MRQMQAKEPHRRAHPLRLAASDLTDRDLGPGGGHRFARSDGGPEREGRGVPGGVPASPPGLTYSRGRRGAVVAWQFY